MKRRKLIGLKEFAVSYLVTVDNEYLRFSYEVEFKYKSGLTMIYRWMDYSYQSCVVFNVKGNVNLTVVLDDSGEIIEIEV